jgi:hypothetical protein
VKSAKQSLPAGRFTDVSTSLSICNWDLGDGLQKKRFSWSVFQFGGGGKDIVFLKDCPASRR